jgi:hypothetical protein
MIAAAVAPRDAFDACGQTVIALRYEVAELVDLCGGFRRRLDLDPAADAVEDFFGVEGILRCRCHCPSLAFCEFGQCHAPASAGASIPVT